MKTKGLCTSGMNNFVVVVFSMFVLNCECSIDSKFIKEFINVNNALRRLPNSTNMRRVFWDAQLSEMATSEAESCNLQIKVDKHPKFKEIGVATHVMRDTEADLNLALLTWYSEGLHYDEISKTCGQESCHAYTHVMRGLSGRVGCGYQMCPFGEVTEIKGKKAREKRAYVVCFYENSKYEGGVGVFNFGPQCSACPGPLKCVDELCVNIRNRSPNNDS